MRLQLFIYGGGDNGQYIPMNKMAATQVKRELCGTNLSENIGDLLIWADNGYNHWAVWALFMKCAEAGTEWLCQNNSFARVLTSSFALSLQVLHKQCQCSPIHHPLHKLLAGSQSGLWCHKHATMCQNQHWPYESSSWIYGIDPMTHYHETQTQNPCQK